MVRRGEVWWADLAEPQQAEPAYAHPVVVVQANSFNQSRIATVVVVALSSNLRLADGPGNVTIAARVSGLSKDSVANVSQVATLDKRVLRDISGELSPKTMRQIDEGLHLVLDL